MSKFLSTVEFTRPANTTAYTAGDAVGATAAALEFKGVGNQGRVVNITNTRLRIDRTSVISGETTYTLHLYDVTPPSALADNAAFDLPSGDRASYLGSIALGTVVDLGSTVYVAASPALRVKPRGTSIFAYLVTAGAYTPESDTVHTIQLYTDEA